MNSNAVDGGHLKAFIERIEKLEEEKRAIADDIKDVYGEAKGRVSIPKSCARSSRCAARKRASGRKRRRFSASTSRRSAWSERPGKRSLTISP